MSEKVVLPKFDLPGQGPHPAVKALIAVGALLGVAVLGLGAALWHHHAQQVAAAEAANALVAQRAAEAQAAADAAKMKAADAHAKLALTKAGSGSASASAPAAKDEGGAKPVVAANESHGKKAHHHASSHGKSGGKTLAKGESHASAKATAASNKKKDDAIDKLLAQFK